MPSRYGVWIAAVQRRVRPAHVITTVLTTLLTGACAESGGLGDGEDCSLAPLLDLAAGEHAVVDPTLSRGCLLLPQAGGDSAEYLVVGFSAAGDETPDGVQGAYELSVHPGAGGAALRTAVTPGRSEPQASFHARLRRRERELAIASRAFAHWLRLPVKASPPAIGSERSFKVCGSIACGAFIDVAATAKYVGTHAAIYLDNTVPAGGYTPLELDSLGLLFDTQLYPIDTIAFGRESDIDGNGVVAILLSDQVNALSPNCAMNGQFIPGYFSGEDLLDLPTSNRGEVFYGIVPDPAVPLCFGKQVVQRFIGPTFVHEFQHMISYHRHVLLGGGAAEDTWLNEGLSLLAEELGGRQIPPAFCVGNNCLNQYAASNLRNAAQYLQSPVSTYLVEPGTSAGTLAERGANWLFVRWLADQSTSDSLLGSSITRRLLGADRAGGINLTGSANVAEASASFEAGVAFPTLLAQWHLANYAEARTELSDPTGRLRYRSWNLRSSIDVVQPGPYPLVPATATASGVARAGTLLGGSGDYVRAIQAPGADGLRILFSVTNAAAVQSRVAVARLR